MPATKPNTLKQKSKFAWAGAIKPASSVSPRSRSISRTRRRVASPTRQPEDSRLCRKLARLAGGTLTVCHLKQVSVYVNLRTAECSQNGENSVRCDSTPVPKSRSRLQKMRFPAGLADDRRISANFGQKPTPPLRSAHHRNTRPNGSKPLRSAESPASSTRTPQHQAGVPKRQHSLPLLTLYTAIHFFSSRKLHLLPFCGGKIRQFGTSLHFCPIFAHIASDN